MYQINVQQAQNQLAKLLEDVLHDEEIIITKDNQPIAKLIPFKQVPAKKTRIPGSLKGQIKMAEDFDAPMSEEELALWYDGDIFPKAE